jgi:hypothetical protein
MQKTSSLRHNQYISMLRLSAVFWNFKLNYYGTVLNNKFIWAGSDGEVGGQQGYLDQLPGLGWPQIYSYLIKKLYVSKNVVIMFN